MAIITIRGQMGSGALEIGRIVANKLDFDYADREIITKVAELFNRGEQDVIVKELPPGSFMGRIVEALSKYHPSKPSPNAKYLGSYLTNRVIPMDDIRYLIGLKSIINEIAKESSIVIHGRGSQFILQDCPNAFHVMVVAPMEVRLKRVMSSLKMDKEHAKKEIERFDSSRREYIRRYFKADLEYPLHYDLIINTNYLTYEHAASIIIKAICLQERVMSEV
jgi:Cytidylate kinase-like family